MKIIGLIILVFISYFNASSQSLDSLYDKTDVYLSKYVINGLVNYKSVVDNKNKLENLISNYNDIDIETLNYNDKLSLYVNLYNLLIIKGLSDNYPVGSPMDIPMFFDEKYDVLNDKLSLNDIEKIRIANLTKDPRIHFALVCGAMGCPKLYNKAYRSTSLENQFELVTKKAINDTSFIKVRKDEKTIYASEIFKWYKSDFITDSTDVIYYLNQYLNNKVSSDYELKFYNYDWSINEYKQETSEVSEELTLKEYSPSKLLKKNQVDVQLYNNVYTQTKYRNANGETINLNSRSTYYTGLFQFLYGVSDNARVNLGFDVNLKSVLINQPVNSSFLEVFKSHESDIYRNVITTIGPKIKFTPLKDNSDFSIQSTVLIPVADHLEGTGDSPWLDYDRYTWYTQLFYDRSIGSKSGLFLELDYLIRFKKSFEFKETQLVIPISVFYSYYPYTKLSFFYMLQYAPELTAESTYYMQTGAGGKYQITKNLWAEVMYSNFILSANGGAGETFNLGLRFVR